MAKKFIETITNKPIPFSNVSRAMELKTLYDEHNGQLSLPKNRKDLTTENALWYVGNARKFNADNNAYRFILKLCEEYVELASVRYVEKANG